MGYRMPRLSLESEVLATSLRSCATALGLTIAARKGLSAVLWRLDQEGALVRFSAGVWYVTLGPDTVSAPARSLRPTATRVFAPEQLELPVHIEAQRPPETCAWCGHEHEGAEPGNPPQHGENGRCLGCPDCEV